MVLEKIIVALFLFLGGAAKGVMDTLAFHFENSVCSSWGKFWDHNSWMNEYKSGTLIRKTILGIPVPALLTNGWHLFQFLMLTFTFFALAFAAKLNVADVEIIPIFVIGRAFFGLGFVLMYNFILVKK